MFWKNKQKEPLKEELKSNLTITFRDGIILSYQRTIEKNNKNKCLVWIDFYRWYFCKNGEDYVLNYKTGLVAFKRKDIQRFSIEETQP